MKEDGGQGFRNAKCWKNGEKNEKRRKRHASAEKEGAGGISTRAPSPRNDHLRDSAPSAGQGHQPDCRPVAVGRLTLQPMTPAPGMERVAFHC